MPCTGPVLCTPEHTVPDEPRLLQRTLLREILNVRRRLDPVDRSCREEVIRQKSLGLAAEPQPSHLRNQADADVPGDGLGVRAVPHLPPRDGADGLAARDALNHQRPTVLTDQLVLDDQLIERPPPCHTEVIEPVSYTHLRAH